MDGKYHLQFRKAEIVVLHFQTDMQASQAPKAGGEAAGGAGAEQAQAKPADDNGRPPNYR